MKNTENAAMPISAMSQRLFFPRRLSGRPEQVSRSADIRSSTVPTPGLNLTRHQLDTVHIHPDSISRTLPKAALPAKMRIAAPKHPEIRQNPRPQIAQRSPPVTAFCRFDSFQAFDRHGPRMSPSVSKSSQLRDEGQGEKAQPRHGPETCGAEVAVERSGRKGEQRGHGPDRKRAVY